MLKSREDMVLPLHQSPDTTPAGFQLARSNTQLVSPGGHCDSLALPPSGWDEEHISTSRNPASVSETRNVWSPLHQSGSQHVRNISSRKHRTPASQSVTTDPPSPFHQPGDFVSEVSSRSMMMHMSFERKVDKDVDLHDKRNMTVKVESEDFDLELYPGVEDENEASYTQGEAENSGTFEDDGVTPSSQVTPRSQDEVHRPGFQLDFPCARDNICKFCGYLFNTKFELHQHMEIHSSYKPHRCDDCGKGYSTMGNLRQHMWLHSPNKPFSCSLCGKTFAQNSNLTSHMRTHTGEKPFKCSVCGKCFTQGSNLNTHMSSHKKDSTNTETGAMIEGE